MVATRFWVETMIEDGLICDAKTVIAIYKYILSNCGLRE